MMPGQKESGDHCLVRAHPRGVLLGVIDGIGHGKEAADAAQEAARTLDRHSGESLIAMVQRAHESLRGTRGVVMTLVSLNSSDHTLTWLGVGNVQGMIFQKDSDSKFGYESVILRGGVVGHQLPPLKAEIIPVNLGDLLVLATDGIYSGFTVGLNMNNSPAAIAERIMTNYAKGNDDALVIAARYLGGSDESRTK